MKNKILIFLFLLTVTGLKAYSQVGTSYINVKVLTDSSRANGINGLTTKNTVLNNILSKYDAILYQQCFPGAKTPGSTEKYSIEFEGDSSKLLAELTASNLFEYVNIIPYSTPNCVSTYPMNDPYQYNVPGYINPVQASTWHLDMMKVKCAWDITEGNDQITIAFIDTEFDTQHEDLQGKFVSIKQMAPFTSGNPHGTAVSGAAIAIVNNGKGIAGVANKTKAAGYITNGGSNLGRSIWQAYLDGHKIINVSMGHTGDLSFAEATEITQNGAVLVLSGGNNPLSVQHSFIANIPGVIVVGGHDEGGNVGTLNLSLNQYIDIVAPATNVLTTVAHQVNQGKYAIAFQTSIAAPLVAGVIALMKSVNPCLSPADIEYIIKNSTSPVTNAQAYPGQFGAGRINAYAAVLGAQNYIVSIFIGTNTLWNTPRTVYGDIIVSAGKTLTITSKVKMGCDNKIVVKHGAKLIIDGGEITRVDNGKLWKGIELYGNELPSTEANMGTVEMKNNAVISYAREAIQNFSADFGWLGGGIIKVSDSHFRNCRRAIGLNHYTHTYWTNAATEQSNCSFVNTDFVIDDKFALFANDLGTMDKAELFTSWNTKEGILIKNCNFKNLLTDQQIDISTYRGVAVYLLESGAFIRNNTFEGFHDAVTTSGIWGMPTRTVNIHENTFIDNARSVNCFASIYTRITKNNIARMANYGSAVQHPIEYRGIGVYIDDAFGTYVGCHNKIDFNENSPQQRSGTFGAIVNNTGNKAQVISDNTFSNLQFGVQYQSHNSRTDVLRNTFSERYVDIAISVMWTNLAVKPLGDGCNATGLFTNKVAGNKFMHSLTRVYNFNNGSQLNPVINAPITYWYNSNTANEQPIPTTHSGPWIISPCSSSTSAYLMCDPIITGTTQQYLPLYKTLVDNGMRQTNECDQIVGNIVHHYNINDDTTGLRMFLEQDNTMQSNLLLLPLAIEIHDYKLYESYKQRLDEEILGTENVAGIKLFYDIMRDLQKSGRQIKDLTDLELVQIQELAQSNQIITSYAKSLLDYLGIKVWEHPVLNMIEEDQKEAASKAAYSQEVENAQHLLVYPNPVSSSFKLSFNVGREMKDGYMSIFTVNGKKVYTTKIDSNLSEIQVDALKLNLADGIYLIRVEDSKGYHGATKFIFKK